MKRGRLYIEIPGLDRPKRLDPVRRWSYSEIRGCFHGNQLHMLSRQAFPENTWAISSETGGPLKTGGLQDKVVREYS